MNAPLAGELLHTCTLLEHRDGGASALYRCDGCGQHLVGVDYMRTHRMWEEIKHLRAQRDRLRAALGKAEHARNCAVYWPPWCGRRMPGAPDCNCYRAILEDGDTA